MADMIFVTKEAFDRYKAANIGQYVIDSIGVERIIINENVLMVDNTQAEEEPEAAEPETPAESEPTPEPTA